MIEIIQDADFNQLKSIGHGFFTRKGGVSEGYYRSLNCSSSCSDKPEHIKENIRRAMAYLNKTVDSFTTVKNIHGNQVVVVETQWLPGKEPQADAMVTCLPNIVLASDNADCPIVLFAEEQSGIIGLAHAGWKGAKLNIIENTVAKMVSLGAKQNNISAVISPCISQDSYEVNSEFHQQFLLINRANTSYFAPGEKSGHFQFNLFQFVKDKLLRLALKSVTAIGLDTYKNEDLFFSCRRAYHQGDADFGGQLSCIYFK